MTASDDHDSWADPKYLKPADCDENGYCVHCGSATVHSDWCTHQFSHRQRTHWALDQFREFVGQVARIAIGSPANPAPALA